MQSDNTNWREANQRFLVQAIRFVRARLDLCFATKDGEKETSNEGYVDGMRQLAQQSEMAQEHVSFLHLCDKLKLSNFERDILLLSAAPELDTEFGRILGTKGLSHQPTFALAFGMFPESHWDALTPGAPLRKWQLIRIGKGETLVESTINISEQILHHITGVQEMNEKLKKIIEPLVMYDALVPTQVQLAELILNNCMQFQTQRPPSIFLLGNERRDKIKLAAHVSTGFGLSLHAVSMYSIPNDVSEIAELTLLWNREAILKNYALFLDANDVDVNDKIKLQSLIYFIRNIESPLFVASDQWVPESGKDQFAFEVKKPSPTEQLFLWNQRVGDKIGQKKLHQLVSQFSMNTETMQKAERELIFQFNIDNEDIAADNIENALWNICCRVTRPQMDGLAQRIETTAKSDDLVLPYMQKEILKEIAIHVRQRNKVYSNWGFAKKDSRGLGITALFAGESGTGKTMAAEVLANELKLDLYRIDLSKVINKYVGETEKNLKKIFDAAENGGAILLFDEADALFGKRSDVKDSHDRYSNLEVSYLLQRMEAYRGLAILTTNLKTALDKAFLRRIRFVIHFPFPDFVQRAEIWNKIFPCDTPKQDLDVDRLARLNLSGGNIRNVALNAAFLAAEEDLPVLMSHISRAAKSEYLKLEKSPSSLELK